ncbi:MAG: hypothetical protein KDK36_22585, partial [Leptospiraceae bacterium]|nr:hypothetical protein [Leptospiraceae bacterium]
CKTTETTENVEYNSEDSKDGFYPVSSKKVKEFLNFTKELENSAGSFSGNFSMLIKSGPGLNTKDSLNGKIYFDKATGKVKIQLLDPFFGLILSQIISDSETIRIKPLGSDKIQTLPMGDIIMKDPSSGKAIPIPFPVIYHTITLNFSQEFSTKGTLVNPTERKVKLKKGVDEFLYTFYDSGLESLEFTSGAKNLQAKSKVSESSKKGEHPPSRLLTRVTEINSGKDFSFVDIQYKNINKKESIPESVFRF